MLYKRLFFPILRRLDAETAHELTLSALALTGRFPGGNWLLRRIAGRWPQQTVTAFGLTFPNVLGLAAGFDKEARVVPSLAALGFGHIEVGTLTPRPQAGNPRPRVFRLPEDGALINRMGFPNGGMAAAVPCLRRADQPGYVLGVSLGKQKETPLAEAAADYVAVMAAVYSYADYMAVNISSPNTPGLRDLQGSTFLHDLLARLQTANRELADGAHPKPLLVKIMPDLDFPGLDEIVDTALSHQIAGIIATNTTTDRSGLRDSARIEPGGLSGRPLRARSTAIVAHIHRTTAGALPIIGVGGVQTTRDVVEKLDAGAVLVQTYTGLVYEGPGLPGRLLREIHAARR